MNKKLDTTKSIDEIFRQAQKAFNAWSKLPADERTTDELLRTLDFDFFELLDSVTIARSRKHIEKYYNTSDIGKFPERLPPISLRPCLTDLNDAINYNDIYNLLMSLSLTIYTPSNYIMPSKLAKYIDITHHKGNSLTQQGREEGIRRLMSINLLKRLESSVASFRLTIDRIKKLINDTIGTIKNYQSGDCVLNLTEISGAEDFDYDDQNTDFFSVGKKIKIDLADMDYVSWMRELEKDAENLELLSVMIEKFMFRHKSVCNLGHQKLSELFMKGAVKIRENPTEYRVSSLRAQLRGIIASECTDEVFKVGLANMRYRPTGGNKQLKYLFSVLTEHISWLEQGASGHPKPEKSNIINYDTITIEHISPQSPSGTSIFTGDDIHKLKNLTLLTPPENDLAANKYYAAKKPIYVNSTYKLNTFFESIDTWNVRASEQWETHLIDMACKIFVV